MSKERQELRQGGTADCSVINRDYLRWWSMDSMVWRGCCLVTRRYFCRARLRLGNTAWAAS